MLQVEEDVYLYLLRHTNRFGESASETLRRLLGIPEPSTQPEVDASDNSSTFEATSGKSSDLLAFVGGGDFRVASDATKRYLAILGKVYEHNTNTFSRLRESVSGRNRIYFSEKRQDIAAAGTSTMPQQIPGSTYWALTNENVGRKQRMLRQVLEFFEYDPPVINKVVAALRG
jgi:negative modulator of initiation of replication